VERRSLVRDRKKKKRGTNDRLLTLIGCGLWGGGGRGEKSPNCHSTRPLKKEKGHDSLESPRALRKKKKARRASFMPRGGPARDHGKEKEVCHGPPCSPSNPMRRRGRRGRSFRRAGTVRSSSLLGKGKPERRIPLLPGAHSSDVRKKKSFSPSRERNGGWLVEEGIKSPRRSCSIKRKKVDRRRFSPSREEKRKQAGWRVVSARTEKKKRSFCRKKRGHSGKGTPPISYSVRRGPKGVKRRKRNVSPAAGEGALPKEEVLAISYSSEDPRWREGKGKRYPLLPAAHEPCRPSRRRE